MRIFNRNKKEDVEVLPVQNNAVIKTADIEKAYQTLLEYREGKANLESRIIDNEQWYRVRHWELMKGNGKDIQPASAYLFNCIAARHADAMDNIPAANILPREESDTQEAQSLSSIIPVIFEADDFEQTYSEVQDNKLKSGTGVYGVFWDKSKHNSLGDVTIKKIDLLNLFFEPGITDIQKSRHVFNVEIVDNDILVSNYPQLTGKLGSSALDISKYVYDDTVKTDGKSAVIDWYYKKQIDGKTYLHYCKFVHNEILFATENVPEFANRGWYDHGLYPFVFDTMFRMEGSPAGFGLIDIGKNAQEYIDRGNQAIMMNMLANAKPRHFISSDGSVNEDEYADINKDFIHVDGLLGQDSVIPVQGKALNNIYVQVVNDKIEELKETTGARDILTGGTTGGVTAASALATMVESAGKLARDTNKASYRAFRNVCYMVIELIRQFYDIQRTFRILGNDGNYEYMSYSNAHIKAQNQGMEMGIELGSRVPQFDISVSAEKQSPYSKLAANELALQFYSAGFFNPVKSTEALMALDMMDFDKKNSVMQKIAQNGTIYQQMQTMQQQMVQLASIVDRHEGTNMAQQISAQFGVQNGMSMPSTLMLPNTNNEALGGNSIKESSITENARKRVAESTSPT